MTRKVYDDNKYKDVYLVIRSDGSLMKSGRNNTVSTFTSKGQALGWARKYNGVVVKIKTVEEVE